MKKGYNHRTPRKLQPAPANAGPYSLDVKFDILADLGVDVMDLIKAAAYHFPDFPEAEGVAQERLVRAIRANRFDKDYGAPQWRAYLIRAMRWAIFKEMRLDLLRVDAEMAWAELTPVSTEEL